MTSRQNIDFGIDLGTTNSAIAVNRGGGIEVVRNNANMEFTPSAVQVSRSGAVTVGQNAKERVESDPDTATSEFKRRMGLENSAVTFAASGRTMTPPELSAEVLKSLKVDVDARLGEDLDAAVITIPAAFELHQTDATRQAAELAGIVEPTMLQEPTAAAYAYLGSEAAEVDRAFWLAYDLGGGTFDAAVVSLRDGECRMIAHRGDNYLGGSRIDWQLVDDVLIPAVHDQLGWNGLGRGEGMNPSWRTAVAQLKGAAESAKIALSAQKVVEREVELRGVDGGRDYLELTVTRAQLEAIAMPYYRRSIAHCREALQEAGLTPAALDKVLLVGGSTLAPAVRELLADPDEGLGVTVDQGEDPVTVVARGAAAFAATQLRPARLDRLAARGEVACRFDIEPVGDDPQPLVGGTLSGPAGDVGDWAGWTLTFTRTNTKMGWHSAQVAVRGDGGFTAALVAEEGLNVYEVALRDPSGSAVPLTRDRVEYRRDERVPDDQTTLPNSVGVGLADGAMMWFARSGADIRREYRATKSVWTTVAVETGGGGAIVIPILQGEQGRPERNRRVGAIEVTASDVRRGVPAGTEVEVTIEIDSSQHLRSTAYIEYLDQQWEAEFESGRVTLSSDVLGARISQVEQRVTDLERRAEAIVDPSARTRLDELDARGRLDEARRLRTTSADDFSDADACDSRVTELEILLDEVEQAIVVPEKLAAISEVRDSVERNSPSQAVRAELEELDADIARSAEAGDLAAIDAHQATMRRLVSRAMAEDPEHDLRLFVALREVRGYSRSRGETDRLIAQGQRALERNDREELASINSRLIDLLPPMAQPSTAPTPQRSGYDGATVTGNR